MRLHSVSYYGVIYAALVLGAASAAAAQTPAAITVTSPTLKANEVVPDRPHRRRQERLAGPVMERRAGGHEAVRAHL